MTPIFFRCHGKVELSVNAEVRLDKMIAADNVMVNGTMRRRSELLREDVNGPASLTASKGSKGSTVGGANPMTFAKPATPVATKVVEAKAEIAGAAKIRNRSRELVAPPGSVV